MGFKASCVLVNEAAPGYLGTTLTHDSSKAAHLAAELGFANLVTTGLTTFTDGIYPDELCIGAYPRACIIGHPSIFEEFDASSEGPGDVATRLVEQFPQARILVMGLHSVTNFWAYFYYENATCLRAFAGAADDGVIFDRGKPLPPEKPFFDRAYQSDGSLYFRRTPEEMSFAEQDWTVDQIGESLAFALCEPFFGRVLDHEGTHWELPMETFGTPVKPKTPWSWRRLLGMQ